MPLHLVQPQIEQGLCAQGHHNQPKITFVLALDKIYLCLSPQVRVFLGILRGGELHDIFDEVEGLVVHVVGVDLVAHRLRSTPADAEQHDSLWTVDSVSSEMLTSVNTARRDFPMGRK